MMKNTYKKIFLILLGCLIVFSIIEIPTGFFKTKIFLLFAADNSLAMKVTVHPEGYGTFCADGQSPLLMVVTLYDSNQNPVPYTRVNVKAGNFSAGVKPSIPVTNRDGRVIVGIYPEDIHAAEQINGLEHVTGISIAVDLKARKSAPARWEGKLSNPPVLLIHGFQDTSESMAPLKNFLNGRGFAAYSMDYDTNANMETMSTALDKALSEAFLDLKAKGVYAAKSDIIAHSLGGLVARYYTTKSAYIGKDNVHKLVFINVPHHGTPWAEAGAELLNSPFLMELYPTSGLYTSILPNSINKGLNQNIQTANIALENDEVVPLPGSMLTSWDIETKIYRIGSEPLTLGNVISNQISGGSRHRQLLFYTPVFEDIFYYLTNNLPYPQKLK